MNKIILTAVIVAILVGTGGFYSGMQYAASQPPAARVAGTFAGRGGAGHAGGGATFGTIISAGNGSITVQLPAATSSSASTGTKIVLFNASTQIGKMVVGTQNDLSVGTNVVVSGTANSDGSITASSIQIRPTGAGGRAVQTSTP